MHLAICKSVISRVAKEGWTGSCDSPPLSSVQVTLQWAPGFGFAAIKRCLSSEPFAVASFQAELQNMYAAQQFLYCKHLFEMRGQVRGAAPDAPLEGIIMWAHNGGSLMDVLAKKQISLRTLVDYLLQVRCSYRPVSLGSRAQLNRCLYQQLAHLLSFLALARAAHGKLFLHT